MSEQSDPEGFYGLLAADSVRQVADRTELAGRLVLDVGSGPGHFAAAFRDAGARYVAVDPEVGHVGSGAGLRARGEALPVRTGGVDVCFSSNVLEHVPDPWAVASEMVRVTSPGGIVFMSFTPWWSPWGGHETSPWHLLGGRWARRRYARRHGREPKNRYRETLFPITAAAAVRWARRCQDAELVATFPRYHPWWAAWLAWVPGVREFATWNVVLVLRRTPAND